MVRSELFSGRPRQSTENRRNALQMPWASSVRCTQRMQVQTFTRRGMIRVMPRETALKPAENRSLMAVGSKRAVA